MHRMISFCLVLTACGADPDTFDDLPVWGWDSPAPTGPLEQGLAHPGRWQIPPTTLAIGDTQYVTYTSAGPWIGTSGCSGYLTAGAATLRTYLYEHFPQAYTIGGYSCRPIVGAESVMSIHGVGRALDIGIQTVGGEADNDMGDPIGNWLIENAEYIGIQYLVWDRTSWSAHRAVGDKERYYSGTHPHHDHLHVELSVAAGNEGTPFFSGPMDPPKLHPCQTIAASGGTLEEDGPCGIAYGPATYWRSVDDQGHGGSLLWTNAFQHDVPSNWGVWQLFFAEAGTYRVDVYTVPAYALFSNTRYVVFADNTDHALFVDQSTGNGWLPLGEFSFAASGWQYIAVLDNSSTAVPSDQHIVFDAVRLTRAVDQPCTLIGAGGGVVEETGPCFEAHGPSMYWRSVDGEGHGGSLLWTNAFTNDSPSNWARWNLHLAEAGVYEVEVYTDPDWALFDAVRYTVAGESETTVIVDSSGRSGWFSIGAFSFAGGGDQWVDVFDHTTGDVATGQHIMVDAIRLTPRCGNGVCNDGETCTSCPTDCGVCCGDGSCAGGETCTSCPTDCGACCGDGTCAGGETCASCAADCGACTSCGDGACDGGEDCATCAADCGSCVVCGDGTCHPTETCSTCAEDCGVCDSCGDGACSDSETHASCPEDCPPAENPDLEPTGAIVVTGEPDPPEEAPIGPLVATCHAMPAGTTVLWLVLVGLFRRSRKQVGVDDATRE